MDLQDENNIRTVIKKAAGISNRSIDDQRVEEIVQKIKKDGIPTDIFNLFN